MNYVRTVLASILALGLTTTAYAQDKAPVKSAAKAKATQSAAERNDTRPSNAPQGAPEPGQTPNLQPRIYDNVELKPKIEDDKDRARGTTDPSAGAEPEDDGSTDLYAGSGATPPPRDGFVQSPPVGFGQAGEGKKGTPERDKQPYVGFGTGPGDQGTQGPALDQDGAVKKTTPERDKQPYVGFGTGPATQTNTAPPAGDKPEDDGKPAKGKGAVGGGDNTDDSGGTDDSDDTDDSGGTPDDGGSGDSSRDSEATGGGRGGNDGGPKIPGQSTGAQAPSLGNTQGINTGGTTGKTPPRGGGRPTDRTDTTPSDTGTEGNTATAPTNLPEIEAAKMKLQTLFDKVSRPATNREIDQSAVKP
ncbi:hypothetical protein ABAC460_02945 [Asticcacaulis sp. AC460]|uniref:hypothetical protein n=1 Tax=Asticcacaulis sp. AC460 TaxID=1282360 RepID=UPI0003C4109F|nr:hypothetical protein [Asticcacaulis sp. AC460]ESQ92467.1 hypothetical protein ABAC460_02945 [Asticcacaulis sp. AC460]